MCYGTATAAYCIPHCRFAFVTFSTVSFKSQVSVWRGGLIDVWVAQRWTTAFISVPWRVGLFLMSYYWQTPEAGSSRPGNWTRHQTERCSSLSSSGFNPTVSKEAPVEMSLNLAFLLFRVEKGRLIPWRANTSWNLLQFQWTFSLKQDFISPQCYQKLQPCSPECVCTLFLSNFNNI